MTDKKCEHFVRYDTRVKPGLDPVEEDLSDLPLLVLREIDFTGAEDRDNTGIRGLPFVNLQCAHHQEENHSRFSVFLKETDKWGDNNIEQISWQEGVRIVKT
ncbi:MAG: hypothetical protein NTW33_01315, partial [Methanoregula sp.]|nr:hypothetical protein [Methanoregula sp.]